MLKLRTIEAAYKEIKEADPCTSITRGFIKKIVATGTIQSRSYGNRVFFSMEDLENYFAYSLGHENAEKEEKAEKIDSDTRMEPYIFKGNHFNSSWDDELEEFDESAEYKGQRNQ
jgi:hypothetical protein